MIVIEVLSDVIGLCETKNSLDFNMEWLNRQKMAKVGQKIAVYISNNLSYSLKIDLSINIKGVFKSLFIDTNVGI